MAKEKWTFVSVLVQYSMKYGYKRFIKKSAQD